MAGNSTPPKKITGPEIGDSGVRIFNGIITGEEYNSRLVGLNAIRIYDEMRRSDATISAMLKAIKLPIKSTKWFVEAASSDAKDVEIKDFVDYNLFESIKWQQVLTEALTHLDFGFSVHEMVFEPRIVQGKQRIVLKKLAYRKQTTITAWEADKGVPGVTQTTGDGEVYRIPLNKLIVFTNDQEGDNYAGRSILRAAYKHWYYVDKYYQIDAVATERQGLGVMKIKHPRGADRKSILKAEEAARSVRASEEAYIREPEGWDINFMDMGSSSLKDSSKMVSHHIREAVKSILAQFLELGSQGGSGSRAVSEDHSKLFLMANESVAGYVADIMGYVIKTLVDLNFNTDRYPTLRYSKFDDDNLPQIAEAVTRFTDAGLLTGSEEDEAHVRALIGFPEMAVGTTSDAGNGEAKDQGSATDIRKNVEAARKLHASITRQLYGDTSRAA